mgnify:CR=1 FL=1
MDTLTEGQVFLDGKNIGHMNKKQLTVYRRYDIGFVFQFYNLVPNLTALENVELAAQICKDPLDASAVLGTVVFLIIDFILILLPFNLLNIYNFIILYHIGYGSTFYSNHSICHCSQSLIMSNDNNCFTHLTTGILKQL